MTIKVTLSEADIKKRYSSEDAKPEGYVTCVDCPCFLGGANGERKTKYCYLNRSGKSCNGLKNAWDSIKEQTAIYITTKEKSKDPIIESIKRVYGNEDGYIYCTKCPCCSTITPMGKPQNSYEKCNQHYLDHKNCDGREVAYERIKKFLEKKRKEKV